MSELAESYKNVDIPEGFMPMPADIHDEHPVEPSNSQVAGKMLIDAFVDAESYGSIAASPSEIARAVIGCVGSMEMPDFSVFEEPLPKLFGRSDMTQLREHQLVRLRDATEELEQIATYLAAQEFDANEAIIMIEAAEEVAALKRRLFMLSLDQNVETRLLSKPVYTQMQTMRESVSMSVSSVRERVDRPHMIRQMIESGDQELFWHAVGRLVGIKADYAENSPFVVEQGVQLLKPIDQQYERMCHELVLFFADKVHEMLAKISESSDAPTILAVHKMMHSALMLCTTETGVEVLKPYIANINEKTTYTVEDLQLFEEPCYPDSDLQQNAVDYLRSSMSHNTSSPAAARHYALAREPEERKAKRFLRPLKAFYPSMQI